MEQKPKIVFGAPVVDEPVPEVQAVPEDRAVPVSVPEVETSQVAVDPAPLVVDELPVEEPTQNEFSMRVSSDPVNFTEERPTRVDPGKREQIIDPLTIFNYPLADAIELRQRYNIPFTKEQQIFSEYYTPKLLMTDRLTKPGSDWQQTINYGEHRIGVRAPRYNTAGGIVSGKNAITLIKRISGIGTSISIPLWHSGIWVTLSAATEAELINFDFKLAMEKTQVGLSTTGQLLNARSAVFSGTLIDFILEHVTSTNVANLADGMANALRSRIDMLDYSTLVAAFMVTMYPNGFPWVMECVNPNCSNREEVTLNLARMIWTDKTVLTDKQMDMMARKANSITDEELKVYREEFKLTDKSTATLASGVKFHFRRPTIADYIDSATQWVSVIEKQQTTALSNYATERERESFLRSQVQARFMRKYEHFVDKIEIPDPNGGDESLMVVDRETITEALEALSTANEDFVDFEEKVLEFIEANTITVIGYPAVDCGVCKQVPETAEGRLRTIVPVAIDRAFFTLTRQRTTLMGQLAMVQ